MWVVKRLINIFRKKANNSELSIKIINNPESTQKINNPESTEDVIDEEIEYEIVEKEILPEKMICPDCGGITLVGLDFCDKCGGELINLDI